MNLHFTLSKLTAVTMLSLSCLLVNSQQADASVTDTNIQNIITSGSRYFLTSRAETPSIVLDNRTFNNARGRVGEKVVVGTVHVTAIDMPGEVSIVPSGSADGIYTTDVQTLPAGTSETDITIYYEAKKIGKDEGKLYFMVGDDIYEQINLKGLAFDPSVPPAISFEPEYFEEFNTVVGTPVTQTIKVNIEGFPSSVNVSIKQDKPGFSCNTNLLYFSVPTHEFKVTFNPKEAGDYEATFTFSNEFIEPVEISVKGTATVEDTGGDEVEGDKLPLTDKDPVKLLNEPFDNVEHNKVISIDGWKNVAALGTRAWWGYTFPEYDEENAGEKVAKVTAYDSKIAAGKEDMCQMLLATPPLDFNASESKIFTFRVMGQYMTENMEDMLMFCYLQQDGEYLWAQPIEGIEIPASPDQNGEWVEYHVDLSGMHEELGDIFHIGFFYVGMRGSTSSTTYYIDDVSFGRTDLPVISTDVTEVMMETVPGKNIVSDDVTVTTENLVMPVNLKLRGKYKDDFKLSCSTLPKEGGTFNVSYEGKYAEGDYGVYVQLSSKNAATKYVAFFASVASGIKSLEIEENGVIEITDISGKVVGKTTVQSVSDVMSRMPKGTYVITAKNASGKKNSVKIIR